MNVSAVLVTRGNVDMEPILESLPPAWERVIWNNAGQVHRYTPSGRAWPERGPSYEFTNDGIVTEPCTDLAVYGRYAAIDHATHDLIYVQDDDVIVEDPQALVRAHDELYHAECVCNCPGGPRPRAFRSVACNCGAWPTPIVCNMPPEFRHEFYEHHALVGFGAVFLRDAFPISLGRFVTHLGTSRAMRTLADEEGRAWFMRTCDIPFTFFGRRELVSVPKQNLEHAEAPDRMYRQPTHVAERNRMLDLCRSGA